MGIVTAIPERSERMIKTLLCYYGNLEHNLNEIRKENIISILKGVESNGCLIYTVIYLKPSHIINLKGVIK